MSALLDGLTPRWGVYDPRVIGWPVPAPAPIPFTWRGVDFGGGVANAAIATIFGAILDDLAAETGYLIDPDADDWGGIDRLVTGGTTKSMHAAWIAIDCDARDNPYVRDGSWRAHTIPDRVGAICRRYGCEWGGDWRSPKDFMHIECHLSPSDAAVLANRIRLEGGPVSVHFGTDISHYNSGFDFARARREGILFTILKATEGATYVDATFAANLAAARAAGLLTAAYHYQRSDSTVAAQVANIKRHVPLDVPLAIDVERNSGGPDITRALVAGLRAEGYRVILTYFPRWYWQQLGSPSLAGLPPLWSSRYPDNVVGTVSDEYADVPASYWDGYGGLAVAVLQFSSSGAVANFTAGRIDINAFRGTTAALAALFGGTITRGDNMPGFDETYQHGRTGVKLKYGEWIGETNYAANLAAAATARVEARLAALGDTLTKGQADLLGAVRTIADPDITLTPEQLDQLRAGLLDGLPDAVADLVDEFDARLRARLVAAAGLEVTP